MARKWASIEDVCHLSSRFGLQALDDQHFGLWLNLWLVVRGQVVLFTVVTVTGGALICELLNR